nr:DEAD/DEAH box helicase [Corynebacterium mendelii]
MTVSCRDEEWAITSVTRTTNGWKLRVRGLTEYVRDQQAVFYTAIDKVTVFDPKLVTPRIDTSPKFRHARLWVETMMRQTPVPLYQPELTVADRMLADPLDYQLAAVRKALDPENIRPRILLADAVGLGKTLEIGMIIAELVRRGRGNRILVVTPKHVMDQFQNELWSRFALPLVRLDSTGVARIRQLLPASRNPFTYFPRVIVSIDTLKSAKFRAQLEKVRWDIVVIDEIHNATNPGTQNNDLARTLAPKTEALILASATPHNGDPESFKEILRLLDPTSVLPDKTVDREAVKRLIIRRHRHSPEVSSVVGDKWAERAEPVNILVAASPEENAVAREIRDTWIHPANGSAPCADRLFPWTLVKAYLSSPAALNESLDNRNNRLVKSDKPDQERELEYLRHLRALSEKVTTKRSAKYNRLVDYLKDIGIGQRSKKRVVVFSERVATLNWLKENLKKDLKLKKDAVTVMHGGLTDQEQLKLIDEFKRSDSNIRVFITGDVASEGVNLHAQCHDMVHYDIPWSLIRIQQRNGRIDRYGQSEPPVIATLLLDPQDDASPGELHVLERLVQREREAHDMLGDAAGLMGQYSEAKEEDQIRKVLAGSKDFDEVVADPQEVKDAGAGFFAGGDSGFSDEFAALLASFDSDDDSFVDPQSFGFTDDDEDDVDGTGSAKQFTSSLYNHELDYLNDALYEAFGNVPKNPPKAGGVGFTVNSNSTAGLIPPPDLQRKLKFLPQDYVKDRKVDEELILATDPYRGNESLNEAREGMSHTTWPAAHYLGPLHPVLDWAADRALASMGKREIPVVSGTVESPTAVVLATLMNKRGQVVGLSTLTVSTNLLDLLDTEVQPNIFDWLDNHGLGDDAINPNNLELPDNAQDFIREAVVTAQEELSTVMVAAKQNAQEQINTWSKRADAWESQRKESRGTRTLFRSDELLAGERQLAEALRPTDNILIRPMLLVLPAHVDSSEEGAL